jgi:hypothetical protein
MPLSVSPSDFSAELRLSGICNAALSFVEFVIRHITLCFISQVFFLDNCKFSGVVSGPPVGGPPSGETFRKNVTYDGFLVRRKKKN